MNIYNFIKKRPYLVWHTTDYHSLSEEAIMEAVLNYGDWDDVQEMMKILGSKKIVRIFKKQSRQKRCNYRPEIKNFFGLYFKKYA